MIHPSKVLSILGIHALKSFGQNFLISQSSIQGFEKYLDVSKPVLEIGPGLGAITEFLQQKNFSVVAIEKDRTLFNYLNEQTSDTLQVIQGDFLELNSDFLTEHKITQVFGNLPFYITSDIIIKVLKEMPQVNTFIMGIQKEVGHRLLKASGNSLALFMKCEGDFIEHRAISKNNFFPVPDVDAMWLIWKRNKKIEDSNSFEIFLRGIFWGKRKNLVSAIRKNPFFQNYPQTESWLKRVSEHEEELKKIRADQLSFEQIKEVFLKITA